MKVVKTIDAEAKVKADTKTQVINVETKAPAAVIKIALAAVSYLIT
ncbi:copper chaperone [Aliterella atlantica]|nr:copper chaperone [Aliterella atlantica]